MPVRTLDIYLENVMGGEAGGTKHTLAADLQNIDQVRVLVPANSGIKNETDYDIVPFMGGDLVESPASVPLEA